MPLDKIFNQYFNYLEIIKERSSRTIYVYKSNLEMFFNFLKSEDKFKDKDFDEELIKDINLDDVYEFLKYIKNCRNNSPSSRANKIAALRSFFKYCKDKIEIIDCNPCDKLEIPKLPKKQISYLTLDEAQRLLESVDGRNYERDFCIVTVFLNCGLRLSELCNIKINDIKNDILVVRGKGDKDRTVYLNESCIKSIRAYMRVRSSEESPFLFLSERKTKISNRQVENIIKNSVENAGLDSRRYTVHKLRHTAATLLYKYGNIDIRTIQMILGHNNISTTTIYTHVDDESLRMAVKSNPLNTN